MPVKQIIGPRARADGTVLPASGAVQAGDFLFLSGRMATSPDGTIAAAGIEAQTVQALETIEASLKVAGLTRADIAKATVWLVSKDDFARFNRAYAAFFRDTAPPARSTVCSALLHPDALVEIEVVAYLGK